MLARYPFTPSLSYCMLARYPFIPSLSYCMLARYPFRPSLLFLLPLTRTRVLTCRKVNHLHSHCLGVGLVAAHAATLSAAVKV